MKIKINSCFILAFTCFLTLNSLAQGLQKKESEEFRIKLDNTVSFNNEKISRIYTPANTKGNMAISANSEYFLGSINKSVIYIRNLKSGESKNVSVSHNVVYALFSSDSKRVALFVDVGDRRTVTVLNLELGKVLSVVNSREKMDQVSMSPDGERIATSRDEAKLILKGKNVVNLWNANDGSLVASFDGCGVYNQKPVFSSDSRLLLLDCVKLDHKPTKVFSAQTGKEIASFAKKFKFGNAELWSDVDPISVFSPDSKTVVSIVRFSGIRLWDIKSGDLRAEFDASQGSIYGITFSQRGNVFATNGFSTVIRLWNTETGELMRTFQSDITKSPAFMISAEISPDGKTMVGIDKRGRVTVWDFETGKVKFTMNETAKKEDFSVRAFFGLDGRVLYISHEKTIKAVNTQTGAVFSEIPNPTGLYYVSDDGKRVFIQDAKGIAIWKLN